MPRLLQFHDEETNSHCLDLVRLNDLEILKCSNAIVDSK